jgi:ABC-type antimicrobial peptide transport system permease subunit
MPQMWIPITQAVTRFAQPRALLIRTRGNATDAITFVTEELGRQSESGRAATARPYTAWLEPQLRAWKLGAQLFGALSALALILAVVGLYSVLSVSVAQRSSEIGIRLALGATSNSVTGLVVRQGLRVVAAGVAIGLVVAAGASRAIEALLYGTSPRDPFVYAAVAAVLLAAATAAAFVPARRAGRLDPITVLRRD